MNDPTHHGNNLDIYSRDSSKLVGKSLQRARPNDGRGKMALKIEFQGFVNEVKEFGWGTVAKMSHSRRQLNKETNQWETTGKDYIDVVLPEGTTVAKDQLLEVAGTFKVETYDKRDGSTGVALKVRAELCQEVQRGNKTVTDPDLPF